MRMFSGICLKILGGLVLLNMHAAYEWSRRDEDLTEIPSDIPETATSVDLGENAITSIQADVFIHLDLLTELYLDENEIGVIEPGAFRGLSSLQHLDLSYNPLSGVWPDFTPVDSTLRILIIHGASITADPGDIFNNMPYLEELSISENLLERIPDLTSVRGQITHLWMAEIGITSIPPDTFSDMDMLQTLELSYNEIQHIPNVPIVPGGLTEYGLAGISITTIQAGDFVGFSDLESLDLSDNEFNEIPNLGAVRDTLIQLRLRKIGITTLPTNSFENMTVLRELDLSYNSFTSIPELQVIGPALTDFELSHCEGDGFIGLNPYDPQPLQWMTSLTDLELHDNGITGNFSLPSLRELTYLDISDNLIDCLDPYFFATVPALTEIDAQDNRLSKLPHVPRDNNNIAVMDFSENAFTEIPDLTNLTSLSKIDFKENQITTINRKSVVDLKSGHLYLDGNPINCSMDLCWMVWGNWPFTIHLDCDGTSWEEFLTGLCGNSPPEDGTFMDHDIPCTALDSYNQTDESTLFLRDGNMTTCISLFPDERRSVLARVPNPKNQSLSQGITVNVVGHNLECSPVGGVRVTLQPSCGNGECPALQKCTALKKTFHSGLTVCKNRCSTPVQWDYILLTIQQLSGSGYDYYGWHLCEVLL